MVELDFGPYVRAPRFNAFAGLALAIRIIHAAPKQIPAWVLDSLVALHAAAEDLQTALRERHAHKSVDPRPHDNRFDHAWGGLHGRLHAWARQPGEVEAERAAELIQTLFPAGLTWLKGAFDDEWVHSRTLLQLIEEQELAAAIDELAGPAFLDRVRDAHAELGQVLGLDPKQDEAPAPAPSPEVGAKVRALAEAIADYSRRFVGAVDLDDPDSVERFQRAMAPLDAYRARSRSAGGGSDASEDEALDLDAPLPPLPGADQA